MRELLYSLIGVAVGFLLTAIYERIKDRRTSANTKALLRSELTANISNLKNLLATVNAYMGTDLPAYIRPMGLSEIANHTETACQTKVFDALQRDLPSLGSEAITAVLDFYQWARRVPQNFRGIERWAGNTRSRLVEENLEALIENAEKALTTINE